LNTDTETFLRDTDVFTIATAAWVPFVLNLMASFEASGIDSGELLVYALDGKTEKKLRDAGVSPTQIRRHDVGHVGDWVFDLSSPQYRKIMSAKYGIALSLLHSGRSVLFVDGDVVFLRDPMGYLNAIASAGQPDLIMQFELPKNEYNAGFWYASTSASVIELFLQMEQTLLGDESEYHDQDVFNQVAADGTRVRIHPLDVKLFACGNQFYETPEIVEDAFILHFNYLAGQDRRTSKLLAMERVGAVLHPSLATELRRAKRRAPLRKGSAGVRRILPRSVKRAARGVLSPRGRGA
jgi:Nucleotide-diphospho-sugar transferase